MKVPSMGNSELRLFLQKHANILCYTSECTSRGELFIYINSTHECLYSDHGSYGGGRLDTCGTPFESPEHPCFNKIIDDLPSPTLTETEQKIMNRLKKVCDIDKLEFVWIENASVDY